MRHGTMDQRRVADAGAKSAKAALRGTRLVWPSSDEACGDQHAECHDGSAKTEPRSGPTVQFCAVTSYNEPIGRTGSTAWPLRQGLASVANNGVRQYL